MSSTLPTDFPTCADSEKQAEKRLLLCLLFTIMLRLLVGLSFCLKEHYVLYEGDRGVPKAANV